MIDIVENEPPPGDPQPRLRRTSSNRKKKKKTYSKPSWTKAFSNITVTNDTTSRIPAANETTTSKKAIKQHRAYIFYSPCFSQRYSSFYSSNEIPFFSPKTRETIKAVGATSATRFSLSFLCLCLSFFLSFATLFCAHAHSIHQHASRATKIHTPSPWSTTRKFPRRTRRKYR